MLMTSPDGPPHRRHSQILVPMDTPGVQILGPMEVFGEDDAPHGHMHLRFTDVRIPDAYRLGEVGQGYRVRGIVDFEQVRELARINGDLGRRGGLLKLWLTDDVRTAKFGEATVRALLERIETTQDQMAGVMRAIVRPKAED